MATNARREEGAESRSTSALTNGLSVLRTFSVDEPWQGVSEIAAKLGLHKSTISRILSTLEQEDLVERDPGTRRFRLGLGVISLAGPLLANLDVRRVAYPVLTELSWRTGETAALMLWDDGDAVCVEQVPSSHQVKHTTPLGTRYRDAASSSVQVFLAGLEESQVTTMLRGGHLTHPNLDQSALTNYVQRLHDMETRGFAVNYGETSSEEVGVCAPVRDHRGDRVAAVLVSAPRFRVSPEQADAIGEATLGAAREIEARLGGVAP